MLTFIVALLSAVLLAESIFLASRVRRVGVGKVLLITRGAQAIRVVRSGLALLWPGERSIDASLAPSEVDFHVPQLASASGPLAVHCKASFALDLDDSVTLGALRILIEQPGRTLENAVAALEEALRQAFSGTPSGAIAADPNGVSAKVRAAAFSRLASLGFRLDSLSLTEVEASPAVLDGVATSADEESPLTTLVTTDSPQILQLLGAHAFDRLHIAYLVARSGAEVLDLVRRHRPVAALIDADLADGDGFQVSKTIKSEPSTNLTRVVMLLKSVVSQEELLRIKESLCDDLLCLPAPSFELHEHLACLVGVPFRKAHRTAVSLAIEVDALDRRFTGTVSDLSDSGARLVLDGVIPVGSKLKLKVQGAEPLEVCATSIWASGSDTDFSVGVRFDGETSLVAQRLRALCPWSVEEVDDGLLATLRGEIGVKSGLPRLAARLRGVPVALEVSGATGLAEDGQSAWRSFVGALAGYPLRVVGASVPFLQSIGPTLPASSIESVSLRYRCQQCGAQEERILQVAALLVEGGVRVAPTLVCPLCQGELGLDEDDKARLAVLAA
jgi:CheY-like chemotaxis protein